MRITVKQYARSLQEAAVGKTDGEAKVMVANFLKILAKRGQLKVVPQIIKELESLGRLSRGEVLAEVISARDLSSDSKKLLAAYVKKHSHYDQVVWQEVVDENLLGGGILKFEDKIIDFSCRNFLVKIKQALIK